MKREVDIVILSDVHLGAPECRAKELLNYLKSIKIGTLILNGNFIDLHQFDQKHFPKQHLQVIQRVLKLASKGTKVYYITGNHDAGLRHYSNLYSGNIHLRDNLYLQLKGKSYWLFHGDVFDLSIRYAPIFNSLGRNRYSWMMKINRFYSSFRKMLNLKVYSLSDYLKKNAEDAAKIKKRFEEAAINLAAEQGYDYVVCGHIQQPQMRTIDVDGKKVTYLNSGDWIDHMTALEYKWGRWSIFEYDESDYEKTSKFIEPIEEPEGDQAYTPECFLKQLSKNNKPGASGA